MQGGCKEWVEQHKTRPTASNFGKINRRIQKPSEAMLSNIFSPPDLSTVTSIAHGRSKEKLARSIYASRMQGQIKNFCVFDAGIVVNPAYPYIGASPDGKVFNPRISPHYGLLEVKCPFKQRARTIEEALADPNFYLLFQEEKYLLKRDNACDYFEQVQGQMALSGLKWCDFCVFFLSQMRCVLQELNVIKNIWKKLLPKLSNFYFQYCLEYLIPRI